MSEFYYMPEAEQIRIKRDYRIPVDSSCPACYWVVSLDSESLVPTDLELRQIQSFCEFVVRSIYNETYQRKILVEREVPADSGHNTTIFRKGPGNPQLQEGRHLDAWFYRKATWNIGPHFQPYLLNPRYTDLTLVQVLARSLEFSREPNRRWDAWKAERPDLFPTVG